MRPSATTPPAAASAPAPSPADRGALTRHLRLFALVAVVGGVIALFYAALYPAGGYTMPIGWDTPRYLDQTTIVAAHGLSGVPQSLPPPAKTLASRAGFPVLVLSLAGLFSVSTFKTATTVPIAAAVALALAAGAFVSSSLRRRAWELALVALLVGISPQVIRLVAPETYTDNLLATALFLASLAAAVLVVREGAGFAAAVLPLGAAGLAHPPFYAMMLGILALTALWYLPRSLRSWRGGDPPLSTPSARLAAVMAGAGAVTAAGILGFLRTSPDTPKLSPGELHKKFREDVALYLFPLTAPLAVLGAASVALRSRVLPGRAARLAGRMDGRRGAPERPEPPGTGPAGRLGSGLLLALLGAWGLAVAAVLALFARGANLPAHRFLAMLLPLPILGALGVLWLARVARGGRGRLAGAAVILAAIVGFGALGVHDLFGVMASPQRGVEWMDAGKIQDAANAAAYLDAAKVPASRPVVFVVDDTGPNPLSYVPEMAYILRSALPAERIPQSWFYVGNPQSYLAGEPTRRDHPATYDTNSLRFWKPLAAMEAAAAEPPVALMLNSFNPRYGPVAERHPEWQSAPDVLVLRGPRLDRAISPAVAPSGPRSAVALGLLLAATLVVLTLVGAGWALALLPAGVRSFEAFALSPALGIAFLLFAGILVDAVGIRLAGGGAWLVVLLAGGAGWAMGLARLRRRGARSGGPFPIA